MPRPAAVAAAYPVRLRLAPIRSRRQTYRSQAGRGREVPANCRTGHLPRPKRFLLTCRLVPMADLRINVRDGANAPSRRGCCGIPRPAQSLRVRRAGWKARGYARKRARDRLKPRPPGRSRPNRRSRLQPDGVPKALGRFLSGHGAASGSIPSARNRCASCSARMRSCSAARIACWARSSA